MRREGDGEDGGLGKVVLGCWMECGRKLWDGRRRYFVPQLPLEAVLDCSATGATSHHLIAT